MKQDMENRRKQKKKGIEFEIVMPEGLNDT